MKEILSQKRQKLAKLLSVTNGIITINDAQNTFLISREKARYLLLSLAKYGWLKPIKSGVYVPVPLEASSQDHTAEDSLVVGNHLFSPCYIGGWTAANFWGFTDQLFLKVWIMTEKAVHHKEREIQQHKFVLKQINKDYQYGLTFKWVDNNKIFYSDPHKTVIDFANFVNDFGIRAFLDVLTEYISSEHKDLDSLFEYAFKAQNKTVFKRIGFAMEQLYPTETRFLNDCMANISKGYSNFASSLICDRFIRRWQLKVPAAFLKDMKND